MRSTKETNLQRAQIVCQAFDRMAEEEGRADTSRDLLERIMNDTLRRLGHDQVQAPTVEVFLRDWLQNEQGAVKTKTHLKYSQIIQGFVQSLPRGLKLRGLTSSQCIQFRDQLAESGLSPKTVNLYLAVLKSAFKRALDAGLVQVNPMALVRPMRRSSSQSKGLFTSDQISKLLSTLQDGSDWYGLVLAGWFTGARLGDLARLQWASVDLDQDKCITFTQGKTGATVKLPLHLSLETWLLDRPQSGEWVFPSLHDRAIAGETGLSRTFSKLVAQSGIEILKSVAHGAGHSVSSLTFHSLRHSFTSALAKAGVSPELRMRLTGHADHKSHQIYTHHELQTLRQAISHLPQVN
jgi:integrase